MPSTSRPLPTRVLVVDDNCDCADSLAALVAAAFDCMVDTAYDGAQAVSKALASRPDVVILDINMPLLDGVTTANCVKDAFRLSPPFLVAITGNPGGLARLAGDDPLFDETFQKPVEPDLLLNLLAGRGLHPRT